jgi:succinate dehydrogenase / fumarate reductase, cytochrome b subunit
VNAKRPVNMHVNLLALPITAVASLLHRVSGIVLFIGAGFLVWALNTSLSSSAGFDQVTTLLNENFLAQLICWGVLSALSYHFVAGIKHLLMDAGIGETLEGGKAGAVIALVLGVVLIVLSGVWVW